ncbi:uncharacterized protein J7T54_000406 [Emericellopsis cladophorae]|uniref:Nephrocystin 3-like N-terminal domain-containing protein n=1 Tax=Emericellopsis cladophorae TaxID=2686198 RepID=A0A9Q0BAK3_9HYPO|nr:uncharacterized protein J7T54_000406 [Emericellopsis cladophorae]KAI6777816.1 hypothetical protein J7T54_000406 [Emericellopsis cladophorae]
MQTRLPICPARRDDFEIAIICALTCERKANAASAAASIRSSYVNIRLALVVGVCGGMPHNANGYGIFLGDVIISKSVVQYDFGRQHPNKFMRKDSVEDNLGRANKDVRNLVAVFESDHCLRSLAFARLGARRHDIEPALTGTCNWLFDTPEFREWCRRDRLADHHGVLWLKGKPGAGKSTLMKHALHYCQYHFPNHLIAAYFFNARGDALEKSPLGILRSIIYELVKHDDTVYRLFVLRYVDKTSLNVDEARAGGRIRGLLTPYDWSFSELRDFLMEVIRWQGTQNGGAAGRPLLLLVDALDECSDDSVRAVVKTLETLSRCAAQANVTLRVCLSSRLYPTITMQKHLPLSVDKADGHGQDIKTYISDTLVGDNAELQAEVRRRADGVFLWVVLSMPDNIEKIFEALVSREEGKREETVLALHGDDEQRLEVQFIHLSVNDFLFRQGRLGQLDPTLGPDPISATHGRLWAICWRYIEQCIAWDHKYPLQRRPSAEWATQLQHDYPFLDYATSHIFAHADKAMALPIDIGGTGDAGLAARADTQEAVVSWLEKQATGPKWWVGFVQATAGDYETRANVDADLLYILSVGGYSNLARIVLATEQLRSKADLNAQAQAGDYGTALCAAAAAWRGNTETVQILLAAGADVHLQAQVGDYGTALCAAAWSGNADTVQTLLAAGADMHLQAQVGDYGTALCAAAAAWRGNTETVQFLLAAGADMHLQAQVGPYGTALCAAAAEGETETVQILLAAGADVHIQAQVGLYGTALCAAAAVGSTEAVQVLLAAGADVRLQAQVGDYGTALCAAAAIGSTGTVQVLLAAGADVRLQAQVGLYGTALCAAAARGSTETVQALLAAGADVYLQAQVGDYGTALYAAQKIGHRDIEQLLLEAGVRARSPSLARTNTPIKAEAQAIATTQTTAPVEDAAVPAPVFVTGRMWRHLGLSAVATLLLSYVFNFFACGES